MEKGRPLRHVSRDLLRHRVTEPCLAEPGCSTPEEEEGGHF